MFHFNEPLYKGLICKMNEAGTQHEQELIQFRHELDSLQKNDSMYHFLNNINATHWSMYAIRKFGSNAVGFASSSLSVLSFITSIPVEIASSTMSVFSSVITPSSYTYSGILK